jgi:hypothetical protein
MADEFISVSDVDVRPRGRTAEVNDALVATLARLKAGQAVALSSTFGEVNGADETEVTKNRAKVSAQIRKHFALAHPNKRCRIDYSTAGVPQVRIR